MWLSCPAYNLLQIVFWLQDGGRTSGKAGVGHTHSNGQLQSRDRQLEIVEETQLTASGIATFHASKVEIDNSITTAAERGTQHTNCPLDFDLGSAQRQGTLLQHEDFRCHSERCCRSHSRSHTIKSSASRSSYYQRSKIGLCKDRQTAFRLIAK